ncbi:hypothetical protein ACJJTC_002862 [Scirpophaga incertulas]
MCALLVLLLCGLFCCGLPIMDNNNTYIAAEEDDNDHNIVIVSSTWLTPKKRESFWPRQSSQYNKSLVKHETPDNQTWQLITLKRKFYETVDLMTARKKAKEAETTSDLNDNDSKKRKTKKPIQVIEPDTSSSEEWALDMFKIGNVAGSSERKKNKLNDISQNNLNIEGISCYNRFQSNKTTEKEVSPHQKAIVGRSSTSSDLRS